MSNKSIINNYDATTTFAVDVASLTWKIKYLSLYNFKELEKVRSPEFFSSDATWEVNILPTLNDGSDETGIELNLVRSVERIRRVSWKITFMKKDGSPWKEFAGISENKLPGRVCMIWMKRQSLQEAQEKYFPEDTVIVRCEITAGFSVTRGPLTRLGERESPPMYLADPVDELVDDFEKLFEEKKYCDVVLLSSDGHKFPAHKAILEKRSPVFGAMFQHDMSESRCGEVHIEDVDGSILNHLLMYMYTANISDEVSGNDVTKLCIAADKYNMESLKKNCIHYFFDNMSPDNVCDAIVLADMFEEKHLKETALSFLNKQASTVMSSDIWKDFVKEHTQLAAEILQTILLSQKK